MVVGRLDGWINNLTGLGGLRDKAQAAVFARFGRSDDETLEALYEESGIAAKIMEAAPDHMLRRGFRVVVDGEPDTGAAMVKYLEDLKFTDHLTDALVFENVFGGSINALGLDDGRDVGEPLDEDNIQGLYFIHTLDRRDAIPVYWYSDPQRGKYSTPEVFQITYLAQGMARPTPGVQQPYPKHTLRVHETRLLVHTGLRTTYRSRLRYNGWGVPFLSRLRIPLRAFDANWQSVENMLTDASQGVFKIKGLLAMIASGGLEAVMTRFQITDMLRSVGRAIALDADTEEFERRDTSMSGLADLLDRSAGRLSAEASMPVTVLMGVSPGGLNATGDSDTRGWYDVLEALRTRRVKPKIMRVVELAFKCRTGPTGGRVPAKWDVEFDSLWQETEQEKATTALTKTQSDVALVGAGVTTGAEVAIRRSDELGIDVASREAEQADYLNALADPTAPLPAAPLPVGAPQPKAETNPPAVPLAGPAKATAAPVANDAPVVDPDSVAPDAPVAKDPMAGLNGAQIASMLDVINKVATRQIPRVTGVKALTASFPFSAEYADELLGPVGDTFFVDPTSIP